MFPDAIHTRFEHSLGVGHLARRWGDRLSQNLQQAYVGDLTVQECKASEDDLLCLELAGYAHDLGHGMPLSPHHTFVHRTTECVWTLAVEAL